MDQEKTSSRPRYSTGNRLFHRPLFHVPRGDDFYVNTFIRPYIHPNRLPFSFQRAYAGYFASDIVEALTLFGVWRILPQNPTPTPDFRASLTPGYRGQIRTPQDPPPGKAPG